MPSVMERKVIDRLLELSPRAFEFFAGDLLESLGLSSVRVTQLAGDGGIDAVCEVVSGSIIRVPAGVQVKRRRQPISRPDIDQFVGALANRFSCGIYVTTSTFSRPSLEKAKRAIPYVSAVDGDRVAEVLVRNGIGIGKNSGAIDEGYFGSFEDRLKVAERTATYDASRPYQVTPSNDLISLRALSYALRVDTTTIRDWVQRGRLQPDENPLETPSGLYFRRQRIAEARERFAVRAAPETAKEWVDGFLRFATQGRLNKSYKPVMLLATLDLVQNDGLVALDELTERFHGFYRRRADANLRAEAPASILSNPYAARRQDVENLLVRYPLDRFVIQGYLAYLKGEQLIQFQSDLWNSLQFRDIVNLRASLQEQIKSYFDRIDAG